MASRIGGLGHRVEHHALDRHLAQHLLLLEHFQDVPGDRLALAVGVGGQDQLVGALHGVGDVLDLGWARSSTSQIMEKSSSGFTEPSLDGRSRICPKLASTL